VTGAVDSLTERAVIGEPPRIAVMGRTVAPLLALAVFINYVDRGNLATAAPLIKDQFHLSVAQIGLLLSAFAWSYTACQPLSAWLAERINPYRTLAFGLALWAVATALSGLATGFWMLIALRVALGVGESAAFPCSSKLLAQHLPSHRLGAANGLIAVGLALGPAFGTFFGGLMMAKAGWRTVFIVFGLASLIWLLPWWRATRHAAAQAQPAPSEPSPTFRAILARRDLWGAGIGHFSSNYAFYFVISWLPLYLVKARGFTISQMAEIGGLIYLVYAASAFLTGQVTDRWIRAGGSDTLVRKTATTLSHVSVAATLMVCAFAGRDLAVASLFCAGFAFGLNTPNIYAIGQTLAGPRAGGHWMGVQNGLGNTAGIVGPIITGLVIDRTGQFFWAFVIAAVVALLGAVGWTLVIRRIEPLDWAAPVRSA